MSTGIIVMGHGHFASGITSSLELIMGSQPDYEALDFPAESDKEDLKKRLNTVLERLERNEQIIILADLFSGTPFNVAMEIVTEEPNLKLYYGLNLGMLMELISRRMFQGDAELSEGLIEIGRQQIGLFDPEAMEAYTETGEDEL
ncbi:PTS sugar transporter subunit IIA [Holdemania filiformis]|uniref:PTS system fructose IIA component n=1 Tax=Holdemania filiformis DSM 12042 TaxID=545696 RepID=B9Y3P2_9FIRM|nr:PTS sugar transporter subunit IIA [Holdemania filiformis]EEF69392.1 PTS system fructose IIA component [Holdemania filiformis DSM 12042]